MADFLILLVVIVLFMTFMLISDELMKWIFDRRARKIAKQDERRRLRVERLKAEILRSERRYPDRYYTDLK